MLTDVVVPLPSRSSLASLELALGPFHQRFYSWQGASGSRTMFSVFPVDPTMFDLGLPDFVDCIVVPVVRRGDERVPLSFIAIERDLDRRSVQAFGLAHRADEWHVHLLASSKLQRHELVADLRSHHQAPSFAASA